MQIVLTCYVHTNTDTNRAGPGDDTSSRLDSRGSTELNSWVDIAVVPHRRLSLRTSSALINGTAMLRDKTGRRFSSSDSSESTATPEEMRLQPTTDFDFDSSFSPTKRPKLDRAAPEATCTPNITMMTISPQMKLQILMNKTAKIESVINNENCGSRNGDVVVDLTEENCMNNIADKSMENQHKDKEDKEVQTSPISVMKTEVYYAWAYL
ncbi:hypothetical protein HW555_011933 [Spodoptera exigua]|uniref:Uncharacterized protein n=1 Tax=Spodoptera exigua TaxID=7107 RepID=A0A835G7M5_SPOEX|nr:hypothetical protein HW555_011933 [Spodoptera exigua]